MNFLSVGDLSLSFQNMRQNAHLKSEVARISKELSTGQVSDLSTATTGDFLPLVGFERDLSANLAYATASAEAELFATSMQASLENVQVTLTEIGPSLLQAGTFEDPMLVQTTTVDARVKFESVISAINTRVADRYVFSGAATDTKPLADAATILSALNIAIASDSTAMAVEATVDAWFDDIGGGFETIGYTGSINTMAPFGLSDHDKVELDMTAADQGIRDVLKGIALAALVGTGALSGDQTERAELARISGQKIINANTTLAVSRAKVGSAEARIEGISARNVAEKLSLEIARNEITSIDPYQAASELDAASFQLETLYALTVRMSRLSLADYMR